MNKKRKIKWKKLDSEIFKDVKVVLIESDGTIKKVSEEELVKVDGVKVARQDRNRLVQEGIKRAKKRYGYQPLKPRPDDESDSESKETTIVGNRKNGIIEQE